MRMRPPMIVPLLAVVLTACNDRRTPTTPGSAPSGPQFAISDAANNNGNPNFFFLPPLVTNPNQNANWRSGSFNAHLMPVVRVFAQAATTTGCDAGAPLAFGPAPMFLDASSEQYQLDWDTKASSLTPGTNYRLCVYGSPAALDKGGAWLGFVDVQPVSGGMKKVATDEIYAFQDDRTLPIKVRIQQGALSTTSGASCVDPASCTEAVVVGAAKGTPGDTSVTIVVPSGHEALTIPPDAVKPGDTVTIVMQQQTPPDTVHGTPVCLPTTLTQTKGCYHISSQPDLYQFQSNVAVEVCVEFPADFPVADTARLQLFKFNQTQGLQALPRVEATHVNCSGFTALSYRASARPTNLAVRALDRVGRWVGRLLSPRPLYAYWLGLPPKGIGGGGGSLSDFGGAVASAAILGVTPSDSTIVIDGDTVPTTFQLMNYGSAALSGVELNAWIEQPGASRYAFSGPAPVWCNEIQGELPPGPCTFYRTLLAWNTNAGSGTFVAGPATLRVELSQGTTVLSSFSFPVTLKAVEIQYAYPVKNRLLIGGDSVPATAELANHGDSTLFGVEFHAWIEQPGASREGHSSVVLNDLEPFCSATPGALPPGSCTDRRALTASNTSAGFGTLVPGLANIRFELTQGSTVLSTYLYQSVELSFTAIDTVILPLRTLTIDGSGVADTARLINTGSSLSGVQLRTRIEQGSVYRSGGVFDVWCGVTAGVLPTGQCGSPGTLTASNSAPGSGALVPGYAWVFFELWQGSTRLDYFTATVTLVAP